MAHTFNSDSFSRPRARAGKLRAFRHRAAKRMRQQTGAALRYDPDGAIFPTRPRDVLTRWLPQNKEYENGR